MQRAALRAGQRLWRSCGAQFHVANIRRVSEKREAWILDDGHSLARPLEKALQVKHTSTVSDDHAKAQGLGSETELETPVALRDEHDAPLETELKSQGIQAEEWVDEFLGPSASEELWVEDKPPSGLAYLDGIFSAEELRTVISRAEALLEADVDDTIVFMICQKLVVHALHSWPAGLVRAVGLLPRLLAKGNVSMSRQGHYLNALLSTLATYLPNNEHLLSEAQFLIVREMASYDPPIPLSRQSYRALVFVQLLQPQTAAEQDWVRLQAPTWPPYKQEEIGITTGSPSRALALLQRMYEAGFAPLSWEQQAGIFAGIDHEGRPTIQNSNISQLENHGLHVRAFGKAGELAARIRSTRTPAEALAIFAASEVRGAEVFLAMFEVVDEDVITLLLPQMRDAGISPSEQHIKVLVQKCSFEFGETLLRRYLGGDPFDARIGATEKIHHVIVQLLCRFPLTIIDSPVYRSPILPEYASEPRPAIVHAIYLAKTKDWRRVLEAFPTQVHLLDSGQKYQMSAVQKEWRVMLQIVDEMRSAKVPLTFREFAALCRGLRRIPAQPEDLEQLDLLFKELVGGHTPLFLPNYVHLHAWIQLLGKEQDYKRLLDLLRWMKAHVSELEAQPEGRWRAITAIRVAFDKGWHSGDEEQARRTHAFMEDAQALFDKTPWSWPTVEDVMVYNNVEVPPPVYNTPLY